MQRMNHPMDQWMEAERLALARRSTSTKEEENNAVYSSLHAGITIYTHPSCLDLPWGDLL